MQWRTPQPQMREHQKKKLGRGVPSDLGSPTRSTSATNGFMSEWPIGPIRGDGAEERGREVGWSREWPIIGLRVEYKPLPYTYI